MSKLCELMVAATMLCGAQDWTTTKGYNAIQFGSSNDVRIRAYTNVGLQNDSFHVRYQGLNQVSSNYCFGRNSLRVGKHSSPIDALVVTRFAGNVRDPKLVDVAYGARINIPASVGVYGFADAVKHTGAGVSQYSGGEALVFVGKSIKKWNFETTHSFKRNGLFHEVEILTPMKKKGINWRGFSRYESPNHTVTFGLQGQF